MATAIRQGRTDLIAQLWEQVEAFVRHRAYIAINSIPPSYGVTAEDLTQSGYLALVSTIEKYDAERGSFLTLFDFHLKTEFAATVGYRTSRRNPLNEAKSLDSPVVGEDGDGETPFVDFLPDTADVYEEADERIFQEQLHTVLDEAMDKLPNPQASVLRERYWSGTRLQTLAESHGVSVEEIRRRERRGLQNLRRSSSARKLAAFLDENTNFWGNTGNRQFQRSGTSSVEYAVLRRESLTEKWNRAQNIREPEH